MDLMTGIAAQAMDMKSAQIAQQYAVSVQKMAMNLTEQSGAELLEMLPEQTQQISAPSLGKYIDVLA